MEKLNKRGIKTKLLKRKNLFIYITSNFDEYEL